MGTFDELIRDLRKFDQRKDVVRALRKEIRKPVPKMRKSIRRRALDILPSAGGLNAWVAKARVGVTIKLSGRSAGVQLRGHRTAGAAGRRSADTRAIDRGRVRAPAWGRKGAGQWHVQRVEDGYFSKAATDENRHFRAWVDATKAAVDQALDTIRKGR